MLSDQLEALAKKHGATSYRNRADTQHPAYEFTPSQLLNLLAEFTAEAAAAEREACANVCESEWATDAEHAFGRELAALIRARGTP